MIAEAITVAQQAPAAAATTILLSDLSATVERVASGLRPDGRRAPLLYVTLRPASAHPGRDIGPRTCMALDGADARAFAQALLAAADTLDGAQRA